MAGDARTETVPATPDGLPVCRPRPAEDGRILFHVLLAIAALWALRRLGRIIVRRRR